MFGANSLLYDGFVYFVYLSCVVFFVCMCFGYGFFVFCICMNVFVCACVCMYGHVKCFVATVCKIFFFVLFF